MQPRPDLIALRAALTAEIEEIDRVLSAAASPPCPEDPDLVPIGVAARRARRTTQTLRRWCERYQIGVPVRGRWQVSGQRLTALLRKQTSGST